MSALQLSSFSLQRSAEPHWVTAGELAQRTGLSARHIRRVCQANGELARCHRWRDNAEGPQYLEIDLNAPTCPARYRDDRRQNNASELGEAHALTDQQLKKATKLAALLEEIEQLTAGDTGKRQKERIEAFLAGKRAFDQTIPSIRSYYRLKSRWLAGARRLSALADGRAVAGGGVKCDFDEAAFSHFCGLFLKESQPQASTCYDKTVTEGQAHGWSIPSLQTVLRRLYERIPKDEIIRRREGEKAHRDKTQAFLIRDWSDVKANDCWVSDHCLLDVIGIDDLPGGDGKPRRMWLTSWMDEGTRFLCSYRIHRGPNRVQVLASFFLGIMSCGLPWNICIDNGKEYRCHQFAGGRQWFQELHTIDVDPEALRPILYDLSITPHFALPYNARAKIVEPWHKHWVKENFSKFCPGYCGGSTQEKPEELAGLVKKWEKTGDGLLPWSQLVHMLASVFDGYQRRAHSSLNGQCPAFVRQQKLKEIALRLPDERTAALFLEPREITCGTFLSIDGAHYGLGNPLLCERQGEKLRVRMDPFNAGRVYVYNLRGDFITIAENAGRLAAHTTQDHVKEAQRRINAHNKMAREFAESSAVIASIDPATAVVLQSTRGAIQPLAMPPSGGGAGLPGSYKIDFTPRADDGSRRQLLPVRPAPEETPDEQVTQRTDSAAASQVPQLSSEDIWGLLDG